MAISITSNVAYVQEEWGKFVTAIPELEIILPRVATPPVMGVLMAAIRKDTPIGETAQLQDLTDWEETGKTPTGGIEAVIFSSATNERTGYPYARARAYGFNKVNGEFWTPPEDPPYPVQGAQDAQDVLTGAATPEIMGAVMAVFAIPR